MDNYLSDRWPASPEGRSLPKLPKPPRQRPNLLRIAGIALLVLLCLACLVSVGFLIFRVATFRWTPAASAPAPTGDPAVTGPAPGWTPEDLPWTDPDPAVQLSLDPSAGEALEGSAIYERALPGVVSVTAHQQYGYSTGTGLIVERSGYVLTNYHIIDGGTKLEIMLLSDRTTRAARLVGYDEEFDLAVLKIDGQDLPVVPLGDSDELRVGSPVYAIGNPMGDLYGSMTEGIVSALGREGNDIHNGLAMIQTSAALNSGNSGGPLLNDRGQAVGITSAKITGMEDNTVIEGLGLAIPMTDLLPFVNHILATGRSWRPSIGISCQVSTLYDRTGILVRELTADAPRDAGLRVDDLIVAANGTETPTLASLRRILYTTGVDEEVVLTVLRGGEELDIALPLIDTLEQ